MCRGSVARPGKSLLFECLTAPNRSTAACGDVISWCLCTRRAALLVRGRGGSDCKQGDGPGCLDEKTEARCSEQHEGDAPEVDVRKRLVQIHTQQRTRQDDGHCDYQQRPVGPVEGLGVLYCQYGQRYELHAQDVRLNDAPGLALRQPPQP